MGSGGQREDVSESGVTGIAPHLTRLFGTVTPEPDNTLTLHPPPASPPATAPRPRTLHKEALDTKRIRSAASAPSGSYGVGPLLQSFGVQCAEVEAIWSRERTRFAVGPQSPLRSTRHDPACATDAVAGGRGWSWTDVNTLPRYGIGDDVLKERPGRSFRRSRANASTRPAAVRRVCRAGSSGARDRRPGRLTATGRRRRTGPIRSRCSGPGGLARAGAGSDPLWADARLAVHFLPRRGGRDGGRPRGQLRIRALSCRPAATRTSRTSGGSQPRTGGLSSARTTSTRRCPARGSGTSSGWRPASRSPAATSGCRRIAGVGS